MGLAKLAATQSGSRATRYEHTIATRFPWAPGEQAVLTELLLRGPQTVGELRSRADRMVRIQNLQSVQNILDAFVSNEPPEVVLLPRAPGQSAVRYSHNFYPVDEQPTRTETFMSRRSDEEAAVPAATVPRADSDILARIASLETRIASLELKVDSLSGSSLSQVEGDHTWNAGRASS